MGRDLYWYVLPKKLEHDAKKQICLNWNYEPDDDDVNYELYEKLCTLQGITPCFSNINQYRKNQEIKQMIFEYTYGSKSEEKTMWCAKCHMFACGLYNSPLLKDSCRVSHSYSNPIWRSDWNIRDLYLGERDSSFVKLFSKDRLYYEVTNENVETGFEQIEKLGEPLRTSDKEAREETLSVLKFLQKWTLEPDVIVIMEDEL